MKNIPMIAFIGSGNMARSLISGLINDGCDPTKIIASNPSSEKLIQLKNNFGIMTTTDNQIAAANAEVIVFSVKPNLVKAITLELAETIRMKQPLVLSIAAGIRTTSIAKWLGGLVAIVRCMPNTPALVGSSATALYASEQVTEEQHDIAESIMRAVGITAWLDKEEHIDTVTALSGSGPAYFLLVMEALEKSAINLGLSADIAHLLTIQTALGTAKLALESNETLQQLRQRVTSPGGTTASAIKILEEADIQYLFNNALIAAKKRAEELAEK